ncbi:lysophospholipid acyltransferase family protein [Leptolyngbya sp. 'hensonii']|uniref:lysophospholipid acyltransferase family protein n=1 Tax=Leptolyngbya sp. 'hensonii' TaxID=1922337 RepID=UPI00209A78E6|nr:lysophospholipid acyltransferase family protein [Leptolyngbya sp. 'hensonii']
MQLSHWLLAATGTRLFLCHENRIPAAGPLLVISNHRSFMDAPLLMTAIGRPIRFACHHYMGQVPILKEIVVEKLGCFPLASLENRQRNFFQQAAQLLQAQQAVGVFPEGAEPMLHLTRPNQVGDFQRGFAHLALRAAVQDLAILPIAIAVTEEELLSSFPVRWLSLFDPSEPLFIQDGWHPMVVYKRVQVLIGKPFWIKSSLQKDYQGKDARTLVTDLTEYCRSEVCNLIAQGYY